MRTRVSALLVCAWEMLAAAWRAARVAARLSARPAGEQPVMADAVEAFGQDVDHETADELVRFERHALVRPSPSTGNPCRGR